ncbi:hypothetical protein [Denitromonas sp.]|uniref:hypothetical protein n=1 Tax=Denitromonas sp. TaxID=2734609 RepID=UPI002AFF7E60|nr:hypothetical protein [Denitromonas sp.]
MPNSIEKLFDHVTSSLPEFDRNDISLPEHPQDELASEPFPNDNDIAMPLSEEAEIGDEASSPFGRDSLTGQERRLVEGAIRYRGVEALAFYKSWRFRGKAPFPGKWGIFYLEQGLIWTASEIERYYPGYGVPVKLAREFLRRHERFHYQFDVQALQWEGLTGRALYEPLQIAFRRCSQFLAEEALANKSAWQWAKASRIGMREFAEDFFDAQPAAYARFREPTKALATELAANLVDRDYTKSASREDLAHWIGLLPTALDTKSLCPEYLVRPASLSTWLPPQLVIPPVERIEEAPGFEKLLEKRYHVLKNRWNTTRQKLLSAPSLLGLNFKPWEKDLWSVRVDDNFRAHLRHKGRGIWLAEEIGPHTAMGHG